MLEIRNLSKTYADGTEALKNISFTVPDGQFLVLIGLSGSGKSTLLRCINRLVEPTSGDVIWNGKNLTTAPNKELRRQRREIAMIFQHFNLVKRLNVLTNVITGHLGYGGGAPHRRGSGCHRDADGWVTSEDGPEAIVGSEQRPFARGNAPGYP